MPAARPSLLAIGQWRMSLIQARNAGCLSAGRAAPRPAGQAAAWTVRLITRIVRFSGHRPSS